MEQAKKILYKAFELKVLNGKRMSIPLSDDEYSYAIQKGIMFPDRKTIGHDECVKQLQDLVEQITPEEVASAFLYSLSTRKLEYRSALGSYWYAVSIPTHVSTDKKSCNICYWDTYNDLKCSKEYKNYYNCLNYQRFKYGGVSHTKAQYALLDLSEFIKLPKVKHSKQDVDIMISILKCVYELEPDNKVGALQRLISSKKIFKSNKNEVSVIMDILGVCGILETEEHRCYSEGIYDCIDRNPPELTNDYAYPVNWWRAKDGINISRIEKVFGSYLDAFISKEQSV